MNDLNMELFSTIDHDYSKILNLKIVYLNFVFLYSNENQRSNIGLYCSEQKTVTQNLILFLVSLKKYETMTVSDLKLKLFRQIDALEKSKLEEIYGVLINYINGQKDISEGKKLSDNQKHGIL